MNKKVEQALNQQLVQERLNRHWSQQELADRIGTTRINISRWERNVTSPGPYFRHRLCTLFAKSAQELGLFHADGENSATENGPSLLEMQANLSPADAHHTPFLPVWNVPFQRNPLFTGREEALLRLHTVLHAGKMAAVTQAQAISGLGGIGKTQMAVEYAYRFREDYTAVLWVRTETREVLMADFVALADLLDLPEKNEQDQRHTVKAVKFWLQTHEDWLLILDNVEDFLLASEWIPSEKNGHLVLTTRAQSTGIFAQRIDLEQMNTQEGALFLLRRAKLIESTGTLTDAREALHTPARRISQLLDGLPLALDQAGAYIEETGCSLLNYLDHYHARWMDMLNRRGLLAADHPQSVSTTLALCFEKVEQASAAAAQLLRLCAFLAADALPEELISEGKSELGAVLQPVVSNVVAFDDAIAVLRKYSLLRRDPESRMFIVHRLVSAVLQGTMSEDERRQWAECAVKVVNRAFPDGEEVAHWPLCQRYLPHVEACAVLIEQWGLVSAEAGRLLYQAGVYLRERAQYLEAERLLCKARAILEQAVGSGHPTVAECLNDLGWLYHEQGRYSEAQSLLQQALAIYEQSGCQETRMATCLNNLAGIYWNRGSYAEAELLHQQALALRERLFGPGHPDVAESLNNLAVLYRYQGRYTGAELLLRRALAIYEQQLGPEHLYTATNLQNLALLYENQGRYIEAEPLYQRVLLIREQQLGAEHPDVAGSLSSLARLYVAQGRYTEAEPLYQRALTIRELQLGQHHPDVAASLNGLAVLYGHCRRYAEAELLMQRALVIREQRLGPEHPRTAQSLNDLATLYTDQRQYAQAEPLYQQALAIREKALGGEHPDVATTLEYYAHLLDATRRRGEALKMKERAKEIRATYVS